MASVYAVLSSMGGEQRYLSKSEFDSRKGLCVLSIDEFVWSPWMDVWGSFEARHIEDQVGPLPAGSVAPFEGVSGEQRRLGSELLVVRFQAPSFKDTENALLVEYESNIEFNLGEGEGEGEWGSSYLHIYDWGGDGAGMEFWSTEEGASAITLSKVRAYAPQSRFWTDFRRCYEK